MLGKTLQNGKYEIKRILGQGGFGITYEGIQTGLGRKVAIKEFFMKDFCEREEGTSMVTIVGTEGNRSLVERFKEKFIKEAQMIAGLEDIPHVIRIYDIFQENGTAYYVMQFIEGGSLDSKIKKEGAVNESIAIDYITQMAEAIGLLHSQHIMHLDIKPANVLLNGTDLYLIDFGVSKHYDTEGEATTTTPVGRSKGYAPIEQYRQGGVQSFSPQTDIYSLGATAYFLVTGKTPPEATELIIAPIQRPNGISDSLWKTISSSMNPNKNNRPHSISEFRNLLNKQENIYTKDDFSENTPFGSTSIDIEVPNDIKERICISKEKEINDSVRPKRQKPELMYCFSCKKHKPLSHFHSSNATKCIECEEQYRIKTEPLRTEVVDKPRKKKATGTKNFQRNNKPNLKVGFGKIVMKDPKWPYWLIPLILDVAIFNGKKVDDYIFPFFVVLLVLYGVSFLVMYTRNKV